MLMRDFFAVANLHVKTRKIGLLFARTRRSLIFPVISAASETGDGQSPRVSGAAAAAAAAAAKRSRSPDV